MNVTSYLVWSPHSYNIQGSAYPMNKWLFVEINDSRLNDSTKQPIFTLLHEYIHLALNIISNREKLPNDINWDYVDPEIGVTKLQLFDEAVTFCISDMILANKNIDQKLEKYKKMDDKYQVSYIELAQLFYPYLKNVSKMILQFLL